MPVAERQYKINKQHLAYLLERFRMSEQDLLDRINRKLTANPVKRSDIFGEQVTFTNLKRIERVFEQGLGFYISSTNTEPSPAAACCRIASEGEPTHEDRLLVNALEDEGHYLGALISMSKYEIKRTLSHYTLEDNPAEIGAAMHKQLHPVDEHTEDRDLLSALINSLAEHGIPVLEFIASHKREHDASVAGIFLAPHAIVLKRNRHEPKLQIFALAHELGHYLIHESRKGEGDGTGRDAAAEEWCSKFAEAFLNNPRHYSQKARDEAVKRIAETEENTCKPNRYGSGGYIPIRGALETDIYRDAFSKGILDAQDMMIHFNYYDPDAYTNVYEYA